MASFELNSSFKIPFLGTRPGMEMDTQLSWVLKIRNADVRAVPGFPHAVIGEYTTDPKGCSAPHRQPRCVYSYFTTFQAVGGRGTVFWLAPRERSWRGSVAVQRPEGRGGRCF